MPAIVKKGALLFLFCVAGVLGTVILLELGLRLGHTIHHWHVNPKTDRFQASSIPGLDYENASNRDVPFGRLRFKTNQYGMRGTASPAEKTESRCRIAAVGDSYTFGLNVLEGEAYPQVVEQLLRKSSAHGDCEFEVLNFGVMGYSSYDEDLFLKYRVVNFDPHVVILGYVLNDPEIDPVQPIHDFFAKHPWWTPHRTLWLVNHDLEMWELRRHGAGDYYIYLHASRRKWQSVVDAFRDIREVAARRNIKVLVAIFPMLTESFKGKPWSEYPYGKIHRQVSDLAVANGFRVVDLYDAFSKYPSQDLALTGDDHPNELGHHVAAVAIAQELLAEPDYFFHDESQRSESENITRK